MNHSDITIFDVRGRSTNFMFMRDAPQNRFKNPLFVSIEPKKIDHTKYNRCLLLVSDGSCGNIDVLNKEYCSEKEYERCIVNYAVIPAPKSILDNENHCDNSIELSSNIIKKFNKYKIDLYQREIVIVLPDIDKKSILKYLKLYDTNTSLHDVFEILTLFDFFSCQSNKDLENSLMHLLSDLKEASFWKKIKKFNLNEQFKSICGVDNDINVVFKTDNTSKNIKYCYEKIDCDFYPEIELPNIDKPTVTKWFSQLSDKKIKINLLTNIMVSINYCHLVLNNKKLLECVRETVFDVMPFMKNIFSYGILSFYLEELKFGPDIKLDNRIIFDIDTACELPYFPCLPNKHKIKTSPYFPLLVSDKELCIMPPPANIKNSINGINRLHKFKQIFNIWTTCNPNKNILDGINWDKVAVFGDVIPACSKIEHPLEYNLDKGSHGINPLEHIQMSRFFNEYYHDSELKIVVQENELHGFINKSVTIYEQIHTNIEKYMGEDVSQKIKLVADKQLTIYITEEVANQIIIDKKIRYKDIEKAIETNSFRSNLYNKYVVWKVYRDNNLGNSIREENSDLDYDFFLFDVPEPKLNIVVVNKLPQIDDLNGTNHYFGYTRMVDVSITDNPDVIIHEHNEIVIKSTDDEDTFKNIRIKSIGNRSFINYAFNQPHAAHRGYYNGDNLYLLPSCVCSLMTNVSPDIRGDVKDNIDVFNEILRMHIKGFGTCLNKNQYEIITQYNRSYNRFEFQPPFSNIFKNNKNTGDTNKEFSNTIDNSCCLLTPQDLTEEYINRSISYDKLPIDFIKLNVINEDGNIERFKPWHLEAVVDSL